MCQYANMQMCQLSGYLFHIVANRNQQFPVGFAVVAVDFADVFAVTDFEGKGSCLVADIGGIGVGVADQAGIVHERV